MKRERIAKQFVAKYQGKPVRVIGHKPGFMIIATEEDEELDIPVAELEIIDGRGIETR